MSKINKIIILSAAFLVILFSGFVFGHYILKSDNRAEQNSAREQVNKDITDQRRNAITETVTRVSSSVVGINVTEIREYRDPFFEQFGNDPFFRQFFGDRSFKQEVHGLGSGYIITDDGFIVTNDHVVGSATKIVVTMTNGEHADAEIIGKDRATDIALLKINKSGLPHLNFGNSDDVIIGEWVIALGNPFGLFEVNQKPTVTVGVVSATGMKLTAAEDRFYRDMIQTDAAINAGNSGGPLVNSVGDVIGMNTIIYTASQFYQGNIGLGFAIPINKVKKIVDQLKSGGKIERNLWLGMRVQTVDNNIAQYYKLKNTTGVIVVSIERGSPAENAGIKTEDIILSVNGEKVNSDNDFMGLISESKSGDKLKLKILRGGDEIEKTLELKNK